MVFEYALGHLSEALNSELVASEYLCHFTSNTLLLEMYPKMLYTCELSV